MWNTERNQGIKKQTKYRVHFTRLVNYHIDLLADNELDAEDRFRDGDYDCDNEVRGLEEGHDCDDFDYAEEQEQEDEDNG